MSTRFCRLHAVAPGVALLIFSAAGSFAANPVGNAPTVSPAPSIERPLAPAVNDTPGEQPSTQHQWVPGHWRWLDGAYVWESGRWELPPASHLSWQAPEWKQQGNGWVLREGFWDVAPPPRPTVVSAPPVQTAPQEIYVTTPPPPPQREVIYERPSHAHMWIGGYWGWRGNRHVWVEGRWAPAPRANVVWVEPRWELRGGRYLFVEGYWREAAVMMPPPRGPQTVVVASTPAMEIVVVSAPPPPRHEVAYGRPSPGYIWVSGYWAWRGGRHVWIAGHYEQPPRGHRSWVEPRWERRGGSYIFIEGRWGN